MDIKKILGQNVKKYRKALGLTQMKFAELLNVDQKHVSFIESGNSFPSAGLMTKIAENLNITPKNLFETEVIFSKEQLKENILYIINNISEDDIAKVHNYASYIYLDKK